MTKNYTKLFFKSFSSHGNSPFASEVLFSDRDLPIGIQVKTHRANQIYRKHIKIYIATTADAAAAASRFGGYLCLSEMSMYYI